MSLNLNKFSGVFALIFILAILSKPVHAFGAGSIPKTTGYHGWVWKHGDIEDVLALLPVSFLTRYPFTPLEILRVYFGNWLRDYSQLIDMMALTKAREPTLRAIISVLGFMKFGMATDEFDVTKERLGCYRPEEHIDNPLGYDVNPDTRQYIGDEKIKNLHPGLRRQVTSKEIDIDPTTGMKNYIANEKVGIVTSAGYIRGKLLECIKYGRSGRNGNAKHYKEAFIHLGALLHTIEDFSAHSNYVELVLHCLEEKNVFPFVGDMCRIPIPGTTETVPPLVTGMFGALDTLQSIIGEVDDKTAMQNRGLLDELNNKLGIHKGQFKPLAAEVSKALEFIVKFIPGAQDMPGDLDKTIRAVTEVKENPHRYDPGNFDVTQSTDDLWKAIEPVFDFHGKFKRFSIEYEEQLKIPIVSDAYKNLSEVVENMVYAALAIIVEPAVQLVRDAIKTSKTIIEKLDRERKRSTDIFDSKSKNSDPSHSILAKDHFSNYLNPIAGRIATATTNWTTQRVVECWDSDDESLIASKIDTIIEIFHHPAFVRAPTSKPTFIQETMFSIVKFWWEERNPNELNTLREALSKKGINRNADIHSHGDDNNPVLNAAFFTGTGSFAANWEGGRPKLATPPEKKLDEKVVGLISDAMNAIENARRQIEQGGDQQLNQLISQGLVAATEAMGGNVNRPIGQEVEDAIEKAKRKAAEQLRLDDAEKRVREAAEQLRLEDAKRLRESAEQLRLEDAKRVKEAAERLRLEDIERGAREAEERVKKLAKGATDIFGRFIS